MIDKMKAGQRIAELRRGLGLSQSAYAEKLHVSPQAVSKYETGAMLPDIEVLLCMSWMSDVSINEILEGGADGDAPRGVDRGLRTLDGLLVCPVCGARLRLGAQQLDRLYYACAGGHRYEVIDGVVYFGTREVQGDLWSLVYKNYEEYLELQASETPEGLACKGIGAGPDIVWREVRRRRPRVIVDVGCGCASGIRTVIERADWPVTVVLADLSHRILKWDLRYFKEEVRNPYVDVVCLAVDCAALPFADGAVDLVFSCAGIESMQEAWRDGLREAQRVLAPGGSLVHAKFTVGDKGSANSQKWLRLCEAGGLPAFFNELLLDVDEWKELCVRMGFSENEVFPVCSERPAPDGDAFPYQNEILQWMASSVMTSTKNNQ